MQLWLAFVLTVVLLKYVKPSAEGENSENFEVQFQWSFINFTWESEEAYEDAVSASKYIPGNSAMAGIKIYKNKLYIAMPRICPGAPVTLGYINFDSNTTTNVLINPYPNWMSNDLTNPSCDDILENVQSMEIDSKGIMWILDGYRKSNSLCPPKIVLYDLDSNSLVQSFTFPQEIASSKNGFLNDLVIDESDGGFAYITDHSNVDPGLVVYSRAQNKAWKLRDASMFGEINATHFTVNGQLSEKLSPIDGIALSPSNGSAPRSVYYCALTGFNLYSISTDVLKNEQVASGGQWRADVKLTGAKQAQSDGMVVDNEGTLYYGLLPLYGVGRWNNNEPFSEAEIVEENNSTMVWTDSFGFDDKGYLYLLANNINKFFGSSCQFNLTENVLFRVLKYYTGTKSYLY